MKQRILVLGGTNFIGRNLVEKLESNPSMELTLFNRGITNPSHFQHLNRIVGNRRSSDIEQIGEQEWDFVIDLSAYFPDAVESALKALKTAPKNYIFVSTCSVYDNEKCTEILRSESTPILACTEEQKEDESTASYGHRKAECERILERSEVPYLILRPSLVFGPYDNTDRLYYWLHQVKTNNEIMIPNHGKQIFSITYVQDLVNAIILGIDNPSTNGIYTVTTDLGCSIGRIISLSSEVMNKTPTFMNMDSEFLHANQVDQWTDLPLWLDCDYFSYSNKRLLEDTSLTLTDFKYAIQETIRHYEDLSWSEPIYGMNTEDRTNLRAKLQAA